MKRLIAILLVAVLTVMQFCTFAGAETFVPTRVINLVYDDSGSMIRTDGAYVDTWCQAKYAMEVFAAMLGEKDTLNVYYMSDYVSAATAPPKISLTGSRSANVTTQNVNTIHNLVTDCSDTPFNSVKKAYADLKNATADEKWLVVLTDGEFNGTKNSAVENHFADYVADGSVKVMMLSMGPNAASITPQPDKGIFFEKAENTTDILGKLTGICNRIFQSNALPINMRDLTTSFSIPMSQLIVFAQGKNVSIGSISDADGEDYKPNANVKVCYSTEATTDKKNYPQDKVKIADNLMGYVATYDYDFAAGDYKINVTGAEDIEVYYKPNVVIAAYLYDGDKEVTAEENLVSGTYRLEFGFVDATNGEKITDTSLLGNIVYLSEIKNTSYAGEETVISAKSGDNITIKEGMLDIDVYANFLEYNVVNTKLSYQIYSRNDLLFSFTSKPTYTLKPDGFTNPDEPMVLSVKINDGIETRALTPEQWELLGIPSVTSKDAMGAFRVEKTDEIGKYFVYPTLKDNDAMKTATGTVDVLVDGSFTQGLSAAQGELKDSFTVNNDISFIERVTDWLRKYWPQLLVGLLLLLLILGYIPPFKKYLPRRIKNRPYIKCTAQKIGVKDMDDKGTYRRDFFSTFIPYKAETGSITFTPPPRNTAYIKAAGNNRMIITNPKKFAGKTNITFDGQFIEKNATRPMKISPSAIITTKTSEYDYKCYLSR